eukprot:snap_masked-scaffold_2-processed-gene-11.31-mRNA-1 protein AED:1.00 eAED:1.00 QI:0/-1/0/0/-1/1/1/0/382
MLPKESETFGDKLFERGALIDADFKPVATWTRKERNEYVKRAMKKYRTGLKQKEIEIEKKYAHLESELIHLKKHVTSLNCVLDRYSNVSKKYVSKWENYYLLKQNEILRKEILILESERYITGKFSRLREHFPFFELQNFQKVLKDLIVSSIKLTEIPELNSKAGINLNSLEKRNPFPKKSKMKKATNEMFNREKQKYGNIRLKSVETDNNCSKYLRYKLDVKNENFIEFTDAMYLVYKNDLFQNPSFFNSFVREYNVVDLNTKEVLFYCPAEFKNIHFDFQSINFAIHTPKSNPVPVLVVTGIFRNSKLAVTVKSGMYFDVERMSFQIIPNALGSVLMFKSPSPSNKICIKSVSTAFPVEPVQLMLCFYKGVKLRLKMDNF